MIIFPGLPEHTHTHTHAYLTLHNNKGVARPKCFFTHTRGYRIGTRVIGFVCTTEKTAKAPAAIGGIYFLRVFDVDKNRWPDRRRSTSGVCSGERKNREKLAKPPLLTPETFRTPFNITLRVLVVSPDTVRIRFPPGSPSTRYPVFGDGLAARARAPPRGRRKRGRAEYFRCYYYYYYFITILLSFKFVGSDPGRNTHGTRVMFYNTARLRISTLTTDPGRRFCERRCADG